MAGGGRALTRASRDGAGSISKLMSTAGAECVSAPTETKSAPVAAIAAIRSSVTPPETSTCARPRARLTTSRRSSSEHVVGENARRARRQRLVELLEALHLDLDRHVGRRLAHPRQRRAHAAGQPRCGCP